MLKFDVARRLETITTMGSCGLHIRAETSLCFQTLSAGEVTSTKWAQVCSIPGLRALLSIH